MSTTNSSSIPSIAGLEKFPWFKLLQLNLGMTLIGGCIGVSVPFAVDMIDWGQGPHGLSMLALLCTIPLMAGGAVLVLSASQSPKTKFLEPIQP